MYIIVIINNIRSALSLLILSNHIDQNPYLILAYENTCVKFRKLKLSKDFKTKSLGTCMMGGSGGVFDFLCS